MFPVDGGEPPSETYSQAAKRQKLDESSYISAPPPNSSANGQQPAVLGILGIQPVVFHHERPGSDHGDVKLRAPSGFLGSETPDGGSCEQGLPAKVALGVGETPLRSLGMSTSPGPSPLAGGTSKNLNGTSSWSSQVKQGKQIGDDEHLLAPVKAFLSSSPQMGKQGETSDVIDLTQDDDDDVDLTQDDDDDDVIMTGTRQINVPQTFHRAEVCYGMVKIGTVNSTGTHIPVFPPNGKGIPMLLRFSRSVDNQSPLIYAYDYRGVQFGHIDAITSHGLVELMDLNVVRIQIYLFPIQQQATASMGFAQYPIFFTVFGAEEEGRKAATLLNRKNMWFSRPFPGFYGGFPYMNPQGSVRQNFPKPRPQNNLSFVSRTAEEIRTDVNTVFLGLGKAEDLPEMEPSSVIITPLLKHQKQGLYFLTRKEQKCTYDEDEKQNMSLWRKKKDKRGQIFYYHVITGQQVQSQPPDVFGGILADMMGLGKTLQILSLVVATQADSQSFAKSPLLCQAGRDDEPIPPIMNAKTTLLIAPLTTLVNWEDQIEAHVQQGALTSYVYHGARREKDPKVLAGFDMVFTTYQVIANEYSKHMKNRDSFVSPLQQLKFFRIVLDEQRTLQSKAVIALHAERRWAVTGTPVQNRLDDLAALTKFIGLKPFDERHFFNQYIAIPLKNGEDNSISHLRLLVDSVTLRRQKDRINLPPRTDLIVRLDFSPTEKEIYEATAKQSSKRVDMVVQEGRIGGGGYVHVLQIILRLRRICAHGRELLGKEDLPEIAGLTSSDAINVDETEKTISSFPPNKAYRIFSMMKEMNEDTCALCEGKATYKDQDDHIPAGEDKGKGGEEDEKATIGFLTTCAHMLCKDCVSGYTSRISKEFEDGMRATCPICSLTNEIHLFELKIDELNKYLTGADTGKLIEKKDSHYREPSTKVKALLQALLQNREEGSPDDPIKSVVFSCWTQHMDLIQRAFQDKGIISVRLDGTQSRAQRTAALTRFRDDPTVEVILVSLMAGGQGLNLTTACRIYMMEPQWNPAAELQAIDRIHRIGQEKPVTTVRYIMANSFEEKILKIQEKKTDLANITMGQEKKRTKEEITKDRLETLRELFSDVRYR